MQDYVEQGEVKQVIVQRKDGSTWTAEIGLDGKLRLLMQLSNPDGTPTPADQQPDPQQAQAEEEAQQEQEQQEGEGEPADPNQGWGEADPQEGQDTTEGYSDQELKKLIDKMDRRDAQGQDGKYDGRIHTRIPKEMHERLKDNAFKARLSSVMLDNKYDRRVRGRTRGKLDMTKLFKVPTGSRSVFMQKQARKGKQYNVVLLIDESGSMSGRASMLAAESALFLIKQFEGINVNVGVIGFNNEVRVHKELTSPANHDLIYSEIVDSGGGTNDYEGMRRAYHMLNKAPEGEKILVMLSDGGPGTYRHGVFYGEDGKREDIRQLPRLNEGATDYGDKGFVNYNEKPHMHHLVKVNKDVHSIGIGIGAGGWQIPDHFVIHDVNQLKPSIIGVLRKHIQRG
jgi:hypothetical protein